MLDEIYYTFKLSELLMVESDLEEYIANNPLISTGIFLNNFLVCIEPFLNKEYLSPQLKHNILNYLNLVRFNEDKEVDKIDIFKRDERINILNSIIVLINSQCCNNYLDFYFLEAWKRSYNKLIIDEMSEEDLFNSIKFDYLVLISHSNKIDDIKFKEIFLPILLSSLNYFKTINCILNEYPILFKNIHFLKRYNLVINNFLNNQNNIKGYNDIISFHKKVMKKIKKF